MVMTRKPWRRAAVAGAIAMIALARGAHAAPPAANDPHTLANAALQDLRAAISDIVAAETATSTGPAEYLHDAQRAVNALVGRQSDGYVAKDGSGGDAAGVLGRLDTLLDRADSPPWVDAIHGVQANTRAAVGSLDDALHARGLGGFEVAVSKALLNLQVALGRADEPDVLGGLLGAMASTQLGVPATAQVLDACAAPTRPGYGMHGGYWLWRAVRLSGRNQTLRNYAGATIHRNGDMLIFDTPAAQLAQARCVAHATAPAPAARAQELMRPVPRTARSLRVSWQAQQPAHAFDAVWHPATQHAGWMTVGLKAGTTAPYTAAQAQAGQPIYQQHCASCHGDNLQGVAAPAIAGHDFVSTAQKNHWSVGVLRTIVTENMPFNDPGSLSSQQYADVMAYLLASNCYPAGSKPFPEHHSAALDGMQLPDPPAGAHADAHGVCKP